MAATASATRYVIFSVSSRTLALPAESVRRFLPLPRLDRPPAAPAAVAGLFRYQGRAVPVLRLDLLFGGEAAPPELYAPLFLTDWDGRPLALLADRVFDILPVPDAERTGTDAGLTFNGCAAGTIPYRDGTATVIEPARLLTAAEGRLLAAFQAMADERLARLGASGPLEDAGEAAR
ncbi:chemotaxis protein CheW [Azospirillum isscasi]|uniref:Chemotaxis protein CheW n=1 Tax=Azospirillum isscasi TaxID=3053926 RepID=A0ABU0WQ51_9PROT|nr:chemotaxis protein CheW [Azospirillum isscasi]MDQ2106370.1 chemotaxis protein CheW [Azospirillum isscasi]